MARIRLLEPYNCEPAGSVITLPGGIASVLILRRIAILTADEATELDPQRDPSLETQLTQSVTSDDANSDDSADDSADSPDAPQIVRTNRNGAPRSGAPRAPRTTRRS